MTMMMMTMIKRKSNMPIHNNKCKLRFLIIFIGARKSHLNMMILISISIQMQRVICNSESNSAKLNQNHENLRKFKSQKLKGKF